MMNTIRLLLAVLTLLLSAPPAVISSAQEKPGKVQVDLTAEERAFLAGKQLRLGVDSARPPFEFIDEKGNYSGICAGFIEECAKRLGVTTLKVPGLTVAAAVGKVKTGEIDVIPKVTPTPERGKILLFTKAVVTYPSVIISRKEARPIEGLNDLGGFKIGVLKGLVVEELLTRDHPQLPLIALSDVKSALMDLSTGKIDVFVENLGTASYNIEKLGITNLKIAATTPYNHDLAFGVRKDWPLLASALEKALDSMTTEEKTEIKNRWLVIKYDAGINWRIIVPIAVSLLVVIALVLVWNRSLRKVIRERKRIEEELTENSRLLEFQNEAKAKLARIAVELQQSATLEELARTFLSRIAPLVGAAYGVFYLMDEHKQLLEAVGGYGWIEAEAKSRSFRIGEGLPGQCAREKKPLSLSNPQNNPIRIAWGGGHQDLLAILLQPVFEQDKIVAVIELGALQPFTAGQRAILDEITPTVGLTLSITRRNLVTQELLTKGKEQIAELGKSRKAMLNILQDLEVSRKEAEATVQKIDAMSNAVNDALVMIDGQDKVLFWNQAAERLFGCPAAEAIGTHFHEMVVPSPEELAKARAAVSQFAETGQGPILGTAVETEARNRKGDIFPVEVNLSPFRLADKWFAVGTVRDITERKAAEEALRKAGNEQVAIFESLTLGIAFIRDRVILRGNSKLGELFGRSLDEMVGQTTRIWYKNDEEYLGIGASTYEDLKRQAIHQREQELPRKDGSLFWCLFRVRAVDPQDISQGIVCTLEDITERKQAERELKERMAELERFSRLTINREEKMIRLKEEINALLAQAGMEKKYKIVE